MPTGTKLKASSSSPRFGNTCLTSLRASITKARFARYYLLHLIEDNWSNPAMEYNGTPRPDAFTQGCRDLLRSFTYEAILACTVYIPPMLFMVGPAAIVARHPLIIIVLHSLFGFAMSWTIHRMGHRLLTALPKGPHRTYLFPSVSLPLNLTLSQFLWGLEILVAAGVLSGILAKRFFAGDDLLISLGFILLGLVLYFMPVYLARLWRTHYYPAMTLLGPTDDVINKSFPGIRSLFQ